MKKYLSKLVLLTAVLCSLLFLTPVQPADADTETPAFSVTKKTLYVGYKKYATQLLNVSEDASITYKSADKTIAKISKSGIVTPVSAGKTKVYATVEQNGETYTCKLTITVKDPYYAVTASTGGMFTGERFTFKIKRYGTTADVSWKLVGSQFAAITSATASSCVLEAQAPGKVTLSVECLGKTEYFHIRILDGEGELYVIDSESAPFNNNYTTYGTYNSNTHCYYLLRSYLEQLDKAGGGVLVLKQDSYPITNTLCIPSNTTIILEDGARIIKSYKTGTSGLSYTRSLFQTVSYRNSAREGVFSGYNGEHDIAIIGEGSATIDMNNLNCAAVVAAHCSNLTIKGIQFLNMNTNHFIELDASRNVTITGNLFKGHTGSSTTRKEAINLDTPDKATGGFSQYWTSYDATPNKNITISDNVFIDLECAIGTHKYSENKYHTNIQITGNNFINMQSYAIRAMNWKSPVISDNYFYNTDSPEKKEQIAIILNGVVNPTITENLIHHFTTPISAYHWQNSGNGSEYAPTYNEFSTENISALKKNYIMEVVNNYIEYYPKLNNFKASGIVKYPIEAEYIK